MCRIALNQIISHLMDDIFSNKVNTNRSRLWIVNTADNSFPLTVTTENGRWEEKGILWNIGDPHYPSRCLFRSLPICDNGFAWLICEILHFIPFYVFFFENIKHNDFCMMRRLKILVKVLRINFKVCERLENRRGNTKVFWKLLEVIRAT